MVLAGAYNLIQGSNEKKNVYTPHFSNIQWFVSFDTTQFKNKKCKSMDLKNIKQYANLNQGKKGISKSAFKNI